MEIIIALAIITIIFAAVLPQFRLIRNSWDSRQASTEVIQNGRVLMDHISRNLSKAVKIIDVSDSTVAIGFIEFQDNDGNDFRYDINSTTSYVEFGLIGALSDLAGPVNDLKFTCYDACDLDNPLDISTADVNDIRFVTVQTTLPNPAALGQDKTFTASAYLRTNDESSDCWQNDDIGSVGAAGSAVRSDSNWIIDGSGADIWGTVDEFHYVYRSLSGDGQIIAYVASVENTDQWAKAGVMIRETLDDDSKHAMMVVTPGNGTAFQRRTTTGGSSDHTPGSVVTAPYWVKLVRSGDTFTGYESPDGSTWTLVGSDTVTMAADVYIGLCVTSHSDGDICTAEIDNVSLVAVEYQSFTEAKVSSDSTSIPIATPTGGGAVTQPGSWTTGLTHTAETGSNRALIFIAHEESASGSPTLTSVTYGGQTMTKIIERSAVSGYGNYVAAFILDESGITAATSDTFTPTWSGTPESVSYASVFLSNVDQTSSIGATDSYGTTSSTPNPVETSALSTEDGDMVILGATCGNNGSYTLNNGFTEGTDQSVGTFGHTGVTGYKAATGASETPSATYYTGPNRQVIIGFVVKVIGEVTGIEGDLLIAAVATDGSTTISPPAGWTEIDQGSFGGAVTLGAWYKLAEASEPASYQFTWSALNPQQAYGWIMLFTGHDPDNPINDWAADGETSSSPTSPEVTTTVNNCLILRLGAFDNDDITQGDTGLTGHTTITMTDSGGTSAITLFSDDFEGVNFNKWTDGGTTNWNPTTAEYLSANHSAHAVRYNTSLISDDIDTSTYSSFTFEFWYKLDRTEAGDIYLYLYDGSNYVYYDDFGSAAEGPWNHYGPITITDSQYLKSNFRIDFEASMNSSNEDVWIDDVTVTATSSEMVSGGAGYTTQSTAGDSGTADFALTSSNASQMLTIAIAPAPDTGCIGDIYP